MYFVQVSHAVRTNYKPPPAGTIAGKYEEKYEEGYGEEREGEHEEER